MGFSCLIGQNQRRLFNEKVFLSKLSNLTCFNHVRRMFKENVS